MVQEVEAADHLRPQGCAAYAGNVAQGDLGVVVEELAVGALLVGVAAVRPGAADGRQNLAGYPFPERFGLGLVAPEDQVVQSALVHEPHVTSLT